MDVIYSKKYFWTMVLVQIIFVDGESSGGTAEPDITLLSRVTKDNEMNMTCVAGSNVRGSALTFITPLGGKYQNFTKQVSIYTSAEGFSYPHDTTYDCDFLNFNCALGWNEHILEATSGLHDLAPVTDERWESKLHMRYKHTAHLPLDFPTYSSKNNTETLYNFNTNSRSIGLSVRTFHEVYVKFCYIKTYRLTSKTTCYFIIINDKVNKAMTLWSCNDDKDPRTNPKYCTKLRSATGINVNESYWTHYKLSITYSGVIIVQHQTSILIYYTTSSTLEGIKQISITGRAILKIHDYKYISLPNEDPNAWRSLGPTLHADATGFACVELYAATCHKCTFRFRLHQSSIPKEIRGDPIQGMQHWQLIRLEMRTVEVQNYKLEVQRTGGIEGAGFWLIGKVRRCHEQETRTLSLTIPVIGQDVISCQSLNQPDRWSSIKEGKILNTNLEVCSKKSYTGSKCGVSCLSALGTDCSNVIVCEPSASRTNPKCSCSAGYTGVQCQDIPYAALNLNMSWMDEKVRVTWNHSPEIVSHKDNISFIISINLLNSSLVSNPYVSKTYTIPKQANDHYSFEVPDDIPLSSTYQVAANTFYGEVTYGTASVVVSSPAVTPRFTGHVTCGARTNTIQGITIPAAHPDTLTTHSSFYILICNLTFTTNSDNFINRNTFHYKLSSWSRCTGTSWIAAYLIVKESASMNFVVGQPENQPTNKPLTPDPYTINVIFVNVYKGDEKYVVTSATTTVPSAVPISTGTTSTITNSKETLNEGTNYNPALYALLILLIIPVIILFVYYWKIRKTSDEAVAYHAILSESNTNWVAQFNLFKRSNNIINNFTTQTKESLTNSVLLEQFQSLPKGQTKSWDYGTHKKNLFKNRFDNLTAYDHSRVILPIINNDPYSDFINSNYIDGYMQPKAYIATQDPKPNTMADFWRMIWAENVSLIAMLTNNTEDNKHTQYWPEKEKERVFINISIELLVEDEYADFIIRTLKMKCSDEERQVQHLQYTSWPSGTVPLYPQLLVPFLKQIRTIWKGKAPMVVHSSNGIGKSGIIILLDICLQLAKQNKEIKPLKYLQLMREQRINMVTSFDQYLLMHAVLLEYLFAPDSIIPCNNFSDVNIKKINSERIMNEAAYLKKIEWHNKIVKDNMHTIVPEIVSYNCYGDEVSKVNPLSVDGFRTKGQYTFVPTPQIDVTKSFWAMIIEYNVGTIVVFRDSLYNATIWPVGIEQKLKFTDIRLKCISKLDTNCYTKYRLQIQNKTKEQELQLFHFTEMLQYEQLSSAQNLASLTDEILLLAQKQKPVVLSGNESAACMLATLSHVLERMRELQQCDVLDSVRTIRASGLNFLPDKQQLQMLYSAAAEVVNLEMIDGYVPPSQLL